MVIKINRAKIDLPELDLLKGVKEVHPWHDKQDVYKHTLAVMKGLKSLLKRNPKKILAEKIGAYTREELLTICAVLHDMAKPDTIVYQSKDLTPCRAHEVIMSGRIGKFSKRFGLDKKDEDWLKRLVMWHALPHDLITLAMARKEEDKFLKELVQIAPDMSIDLLVFYYADMIGSDLLKLNRKEYLERERIILKYLTKLGESG
ncbi:hypothetical protein A3D85_02070 [Candidatus Amesbacteria bacterium RIFCSPHIGHO2_02_FULL_47_9]|uniref:HD domain-containing protein n=1 Tax=Candidatus Amesbacteria bacterium RIFCSPHIGHO2_01_FULL_48_32b TaxID=1797253 RepID=A0A1F4YD47_9BACT|nr:MAG: hypothetical protein A2876_03135 [Candidatus Amesbacteria bacterium RIFCSPHIGHO2_01_FULL_48_32b]OGD04550.1 MAG: hypothetical protein A3D85_02070 [Candidatus Amesbacteria bacterium RIFCSPHIGHO2_02_FULL_47_9]OGD08446.1 MAG: hypothetical protein A2899_01475 [Candidatus Amesbacteria bacterium RIFCSPLOWO2_01_FULL_49_25]